MKVMNDAKRQAHPLARLIPKKIWDERFKYSMTQYYPLIFELMASENIMHQLSTMKLPEKIHLMADLQRALWISAILSHQELPLDERIECSKILKMRSSDLFISALIIDDKVLAHYVLSEIEQDADRIQEFLIDSYFQVFFEAAGNGDLEIINRLVVLAESVQRDTVSEMLKKLNFRALGRAAANGDIKMFNHLVALAENNRIAASEILGANDFTIFKSATFSGQLKMVDRLVALAEDADGITVPDMFKDSHFSVFQAAVVDGDIQMFNHLIALAETYGVPVSDILRNREFSVFCSAAGNGDIMMFNRLIELAEPYEGLVFEMLKARDFSVFSEAARKGRLEMFESLIRLADANNVAVSDMLQANEFDGFQAAVFAGQYEMVDRLVALVEGADGVTVSDMLMAQAFEAFGSAVTNGDLVMFNHLVALAVDNEIPVSDILMAKESDAFVQAATNGDLEMVKCFVALAEKEDGIVVLDMFRAQDFAAFHEAAANGHLEMVNYFSVLAKVNGISISDILKVRDFETFQDAVVQKHPEVAHRLLELSPLLFADAEYNYQPVFSRHIYGDIIGPFMENQLARLKERQEVYRESNPSREFDLEQEEESVPAQLCFYMVRNLIRRSIRDKSLLDDIEFLLSIPSVKALAAVSVNEGEVNELYKLAVKIQNHAAAERLLQIPGVREEATEPGHIESTELHATSRHRFIGQKTTAPDNAPVDTSTSCSCIVL